MSADEYNAVNNYTRQFFLAFQDKFVWSLVPWNFLYDVYTAWFQRLGVSVKREGRNKFQAIITQMLEEDRTLPWTTTPNAVSSKKTMELFEPLIGEFDLMHWRDLEMASRQRGIVRRK